MGRKFRPHELGFPFREVLFITVGYCINENSDIDHKYPLGDQIYTQVLAHAHGCPLDMYRRCICVSDESWLSSKEIMWHEYAHVLTPLRGFVVNCYQSTETVVTETADELEGWKNGHNLEWQKVMVSFGLNPRPQYSGEIDYNVNW